jgi:SAM-dependent methyltransferase
VIKPTLLYTVPGGFSRSLWRRTSDSRFLTRFFAGKGLDIGGDRDPLVAAKEFFPKLTDVDTWGEPDGDAQTMMGVQNESYDFVFSSHCLEHLSDPKIGFKRWSELPKTGGYLIVEIPLWELYEKEQWPSRYSADHNTSFTLNRSTAQSAPHLYSVIDLLTLIDRPYELIKIEKLDHLYPYVSNWEFDTCLLPYVHASAEIVIQFTKA